MSVDPGLVVTDEDIGDSYTLSIAYTASTDSAYFSINDTSGIITFATNYDVDIIHPTDVHLTIVCTDLDGKTGTCTTLYYDYCNWVQRICRLRGNAMIDFFLRKEFNCSHDFTKFILFPWKTVFLRASVAVRKSWKITEYKKMTNTLSLR